MRAAQTPEDLQRALLNSVRGLKRRERERIKTGIVTREQVEAQAERDAVDALIAEAESELAKLEE